ncbi:MAG TPA: hypothetical protein VL990_08470 [Acidobacteriaceae bacterium]|nr:hypothetical protein [Acidobacteriaceae bacterium]
MLSCARRCVSPPGADHFFFVGLLAPLFFAALFFGTLAPAFRASDNPIAIACLRLVTFLPLRPLFNVPIFFSRIARATFFAAPAPYLLVDGFLFVGIRPFSLLLYWEAAGKLEVARSDFQGKPIWKMLSRRANAHRDPSAISVLKAS